MSRYWRRVVDPRTHTTAFVDMTSGPTSPRVAAAPVSVRRPSGGEGDAWERHIDPSTGFTFFYNFETGETQWTRPGGSSASGARAGATVIRGVLPLGVAALAPLQNVAGRWMLDGDDAAVGVAEKAAVSSSPRVPRTGSAPPPESSPGAQQSALAASSGASHPPLPHGVVLGLESAEWAEEDIAIALTTPPLAAPALVPLPWFVDRAAPTPEDSSVAPVWLLVGLTLLSEEAKPAVRAQKAKEKRLLPPTFRLSLWSETTRVTDDVSLKAFHRKVKGTVWGAFGPLPPVPSLPRATLHVVYFDKHPVSISTVDVDFTGQEAAPAPPGTPAPATPSSAAAPNSLTPTKQQTSAPAAAVPPCFTCRSHRAAISLASGPRSTNTALGIDSRPAAIRLQLALLDRPPLSGGSGGIPAIAIARPLVLSPADFLPPPQRRNDLYISADLEVFDKNAKSVEGMTVPAEYVLKATAIASCSKVAGATAVAQSLQYSRQADAGPFSRVRMSIPADAFDDKTLYVVLDFQSHATRSGAAALEDSAGSSGKSKKKKVSFAWAYFKLYGKDGSLVPSGNIVPQVYVGPPHHTADKKTGKYIPIVPSLTAPEDIKPDPKYSKRAAVLEDKSLAGLAVTALPVSLQIVSSNVADSVKSETQLRVAAVAAVTSGSASAMEKAVAQAGPMSLVTLLAQSVRQLREQLESSGKVRAHTLEHCGALMPAMSRWVEMASTISRSPQLSEFFTAEVIAVLPADFVRAYIEFAFKDLGKHDMGSHSWTRTCRCVCMFIRHLLRDASTKKGAVPVAAASSSGSALSLSTPHRRSQSALASSAGASSPEVITAILDMLCGRGSTPPAKSLELVLWALGTLYPFILFSVPADVFLRHATTAIRAAREHEHLHRAVAALIAVIFGESEAKMLEHEQRQVRTLLLPLCIDVAAKTLVRSEAALEAAGTALLLRAAGSVAETKYENDLASLVAVAVQLALRCQPDHTGVAVALLHFFCLLDRCPASLRLGATREMPTVDETGAVIARLSFAWLSLLDYLLACSKGSGQPTRLALIVSESIVKAVGLLVDNFIRAQGEAWSTVPEIPHGALLSLLTVVVDPDSNLFPPELAAPAAAGTPPASPAPLSPPPMCSTAVNRGKLSAALALCRDICTSMDCARARLDSAVVAAAAPAFLRVLCTARDEEREDAAAAATVACLCSMIVSEFRATQALDGLLAGGTTWLAPSVFQRQDVRWVSQVCERIPRWVATEASAHLKKMKVEHGQEIARAVAGFERHVGWVCSTVRAAVSEPPGTGADDTWQSVLSLFFHRGPDRRSRALLTTAMLHAAKRCVEAARARGEFEVEARLLALNYDLSWELVAQDMSALEHTDLPWYGEARHSLYRTLEALLHAADFEAAMTVAKRMKSDGVLTGAQFKDVVLFLGSQLVFSLPPAYYVLRFDGYALPPAVDGGVFVCRLPPHQTPSALITRLRARFGKDLEVILGTGERAPVFRPARSVSVSPAWPTMEVDRWNDRIRMIKPERCPASVSHKPVCSQFSAFFPIYQPPTGPSTPVPPESPASPAGPAVSVAAAAGPAPPPYETTTTSTTASALDLAPSTPSKGFHIRMPSTNSRLRLLKEKEEKEMREREEREKKEREERERMEKERKEKEAPKPPVTPSSSPSGNLGEKAAIKTPRALPTPLTKALEVSAALPSKTPPKDDYQRQQQQEQQRRFQIGGKSMAVPSDVSKTIPPSHGPCMRLNIEVERELPGPLWMSRVRAWSYCEASFVDSCTGWVSLQCTKLLHLCSRVRGLGRRITKELPSPPPSVLLAASSSPLSVASSPGPGPVSPASLAAIPGGPSQYRCPACSERSKTDLVVSVESLLPDVSMVSDDRPAPRKEGEDQPYQPPAFLASVPRAYSLERTDYALDVLRAAVGEVISDGSADHLLGLRQCIDAVIRETTRRRVLQEHLEASLRREYIRESKRREASKQALQPKPDFASLRVVGQVQYERLQDWLMQLRRIVGYAFLHLDRLSKQSPEEIAEHLRWEEIFWSLYSNLELATSPDALPSTEPS